MYVYVYVYIYDVFIVIDKREEEIVWFMWDCYVLCKIWCC